MSSAITNLVIKNGSWAAEDVAFHIQKLCDWQPFVKMEQGFWGGKGCLDVFGYPKTPPKRRVGFGFWVRSTQAIPVELDILVYPRQGVPQRNQPQNPTPWGIKKLALQSGQKLAGSWNFGVSTSLPKTFPVVIPHRGTTH